MDTSSICSTSGQDSSTIESALPSDVVAKLRRLKIQESLISASLEKCNFEFDDCSTVDSALTANWQTYSTNLRNNITQIKNMFEDIKIATDDTQENIKDINIEEIKKDILHFNDKIKSLQNHITTELKSLKSEEEDIVIQMSAEPKLERKIKGKLKNQSKQYNEVVPSPVRVLINSPLKCSEVQKFQEFMTKSKSRYGGWNEYNHNIFVQIWNKFYATDNIINLETNMKEIHCNKLLSQFKDEVYDKIPGVQLDDIIIHSKWFSEYCYLKMAQQLAIDKWRDNKRKIKGRQEKPKDINGTLQNSRDLFKKHNKTYLTTSRKSNFKRRLEVREFETNQEIFEDSNLSSDSLQKNEEFCNDSKSLRTTFQDAIKNIIPKTNSFATPTEQWINRCHDNAAREIPRYFNSNIESIKKLCTPDWRLSIHTKTL